MFRACKHGPSRYHCQVEAPPQASIWHGGCSRRAFACHNMEDAYPSWGKLLPGLLADDVPAHLWLHEKTGRDINLWQYWEEHPALQEQFSRAMTSWDNMVLSQIVTSKSLFPFRRCRLHVKSRPQRIALALHDVNCRPLRTVCGPRPAVMTRLLKG